MGLKCGNSINYTINDVTLRQLISIAKVRMNRRVQPTSPIIDVDASWIIRRCHDRLPIVRINYLLGICLCLILEGCSVTIVCDGESRHHTKRSTTHRSANYHRNSLEFHFLKYKLSFVSKSIRRGNLTAEERNNLLVEKDVLVRQTKKLEKQFANTKINVGDELFQKINEEINKLTLMYSTIDIKSHLKVIQAEFQADSVIAYRSVRCLNDLVLCNDSDQSVHVGNECCCIFDFKYVDLILNMLKSKTKGR